jgi:pyrrolidone-carboxylate peptidase
MPVSYRRSLELTARAVVTHAPDVVLGIGVAVSRSRPQLERTGRAKLGPMLDVDQRKADWRGSPHQQRPARLPLRLMCEAAGLEVSDDCGGYVCNGWMYASLGMLPQRVQVGFLHIPYAGISAQVVRQALAVVPVLGSRSHGH